MNKVILVRYGEIFLKGKNFHFFEKKLLDNVKVKLQKYNCDVVRINKRFLVENYEERFEKKIISDLKKDFGLYSISPAVKIETSEDGINNYFKDLKFKENTFRVSVNRADKRFPLTSIDYSKKLGGIILKNNNHLKVDLHNPNINIQVDIREDGYSFIFHEVIPCAGGMPVGTSGSGMLLLSGGIDSPVAGYMVAKRGMPISALHFHSYPYTSIDAKNKVIELANIIKDYTGEFKLYVVSFTKIQEAIHKHCDGDYMITLMRRIMYRIAERLSLSLGVQSIITGENLGQVASQTVESMTVTNDVVKKLPIFRPLICFDKEEISKVATDIGTFDTSILPYEDCCTVFLPKHPVIKPKIDKCEKEEKNEKSHDKSFLDPVYGSGKLLNTMKGYEI